MEPPPQLRDLDLNTLIGQPVEQARAIVEAAGGTLRAVEAGMAMTADFRPNRVTVIAVGGEVIEVRGLG